MHHMATFDCVMLCIWKCIIKVVQMLHCSNWAWVVLVPMYKIGFNDIKSKNLLPKRVRNIREPWRDPLGSRWEQCGDILGTRCKWKIHTLDPKCPQKLGALQCVLHLLIDCIGILFSFAYQKIVCINARFGDKIFAPSWTKWRWQLCVDI
jgi:hypothetical protein